MAINIIYEDKDVLVINKPAGLLVHAVFSPRTDLSADSRSVLGEPTLVDWLIQKYPEIKNTGDDPKIRPGIVHRLDKDTSGVMIIAKNQPAFEYLKSQFSPYGRSPVGREGSQVKKTYLALVCGKLKEKEGVINLPIGRSRKSPVLRLASEKARGKLREAITEYKVLEFFEPKPGFGFNGFTLVEIYPKTGRTHQIRVHFKAIGHPVAGDTLYGPKRSPFGRSPVGRQFLHASSLELNLPNGSCNKFEADLPEDLENALRQLRENQNYDNN